MDVEAGYVKCVWMKSVLVRVCISRIAFIHNDLFKFCIPLRLLKRYGNQAGDVLCSSSLGVVIGWGTQP